MPRTSEASRDDAIAVFLEMSAGGKKVTATAVHRELKRRHGGRNVRSLRAVQGDIRSLERVANKVARPFVPETWATWCPDVVPPACHGSVLVINSVSRELVSRHLYVHEARLAGQICFAISDLDPTVQWFVTYCYGFYEEIRQRYGISKQVTSTISASTTSHVDTLLAFQPWKPENRKLWYLKDAAPWERGGRFIEQLERLLRRKTLPDDLGPPFAEWATTHLLGPWDARTDEWSWEQLLGRRYGLMYGKEKNNAET